MFFKVLLVSFSLFRPGIARAPILGAILVGLNFFFKYKLLYTSFSIYYNIRAYSLVVIII